MAYRSDYNNANANLGVNSSGYGGPVQFSSAKDVTWRQISDKIRSIGKGITAWL